MNEEGIMHDYFSMKLVKVHHEELLRVAEQVPVALQGYSIEAGCAADYDILLVGGEG